jgi:hypothetical protein
MIDASSQLVRLMRTACGVDTVVRPYDLRPAADFMCHPAYVGLLLAEAKNPTGTVASYVDVPSGLGRAWRAHLGNSTRARIGVVWKTSEQPNPDRHRTRRMPLEDLRPLASLPGGRLHSLQTETTADERAQQESMSLVNLGSQLRDLSDTAAAILALDLLVTVDTASAHVAGALGRACWVLLPFAGCWRWGLHRDSTVWYDSLRLFRQPSPGAWSAVIADVCSALQVWLQPVRHGGMRQRNRRGRDGEGWCCRHDTRDVTQARTAPSARRVGCPHARCRAGRTRGVLRSA